MSEAIVRHRFSTRETAVDIAVGYFYLPGFPEAAACL